MKLKILLSILFIPGILSYGVAQQNDFAQIGAEWYYTYTFGGRPENHFNRVVSEKDTIVEGSNCRVLRQYYDNSTLASHTYIIKQEQGKIYHYYRDRFNLLLDFDAEVNDTIEFTFRYKKCNYDFPLGKDTLFSARFKIESVIMNDRNLKTFKANVLEEDILDFWGILVPGEGYYPYTYSEKIGIHREFMPEFINVPYPAVQLHRGIRCYSDADFSFISDEWAAKDLPCNHTISTDIDIPQNERKTMIYPNPVNDLVFIFTNQGGDLEIRDTSGRLVARSKLSHGMNEIPAAHFPGGIYLLKIQNKNNRIQTFKMMKL